jgi:N-acetylated-alpha-linked acidic dipeptidase
LEALRRVDEVLMGMERTLTREEGLPRRPWYKHLVYAPGFYTGYAVKTLPAVREAIEERHWEDVNEQIEITAAALRRFSDQIERAGRVLGEPP